METRKTPEIPMVPKGHFKNVEYQRDQYKAERDTLIDDIAVLKANISRLERENKKKGEDADRLGYRWRNSHDEADKYKSLLSEFSQHIGSNPSSSTYKKFRKQLDDIGIRESE
ncbi:MULTISPECIES: hypothetical protein [Staphylococcus]|uniref:hypothetical protein n=1 Tax=Staphylococcus TaxID=1279 RepID=UPI0009905108|nr:MULTISPECIES: hypothetical protein [Staphylococcus]MDW3894472.1 hypothetical protein [Staphylococcus saprophyticus]OOO71646.1 hypothetical protein B0W56_06830 [Staphylococcus saprophyticus]